MKKYSIFLSGLLLILMFSIANVNLQNEVNGETNSTDKDVTVDSIKRLNPETLFDSSPLGFSQVVIAPEGDTAYISGQGAFDANGNIIGETFKEQLPIVFKNIKHALEAIDAKPENVVKFQVFIVNHNEEYLEQLHNETREFFGNNFPANTLIPVPRLALDNMLVEIDAIVVIPNK
ncbi:MAG: RidA family protein [Nitrososphaeraceae archaeon]